MTIDGYTQPGATKNTLEQGTNAVLRIELDGTAAQGSSADDPCAAVPSSSILSTALVPCSRVFLVAPGWV